MPQTCLLWMRILSGASTSAAEVQAFLREKGRGLGYEMQQ